MPPLAYVADRHTKATLAETPSLSRNNLTAGPSLLGVVHNAQTLMVPVARALAGDAIEKLPIFTKDGNREIFQAKVVVLGADVFFVLCTATRVLVYDQKGYMLRHSRAVPGSPSAVAGPSGEFSLVNHARGVCSACSADARAFVCVGTARGSVLVVEYDGARFADAAELDVGHDAPLADLASEVDSHRGAAPPGAAAPKPFLASGDEAGQVVVWNARSADRFEPSFSVRVGAPVAALGARGDAVIVADVSGVVSFVGLTSQRVFCEMQAHSRYLSAMDVHPTRDTFATCAEDGTLAVWGMPSEGGAGEAGKDPTCAFADAWEDGMLTGVAFCGEGWDCLAVVAHDETELRVYQ